jgi:type I restriction enzyme S subunit
MEEWKEYKLRDVLCNKGYIRGPFGSALKRGDLLCEGIPVYEQQHAIYNKRDFRFYISEDKYNEMKRFTVYPDDIIISCSGTVGEVSLIKKNDPKGIISQALLLLRADNKIISPEFLLYFFKTAKGHNSITSRSSGSVQVNIARREVIEDIPLFIPCIEKQKRIVSILKSLDDKIEVNRKINENLEQQAQALFKHWFIDFAPFKDGKFIESELGLIPEGWRVGTLGDVAELRKPSIKPQDNILYTHYSIPAFDNNKRPSIDEGSTIKSNKFGISDGAVLLSKLNPSTKRIWYTGNVPDNSVSYTEFLPFYSKNKELTPFVYCYLNCDRNYREIANGAKGTTNSHQRIDANSILTRGLAYSEEAIKKFCDCCQYLMELILEANQESLRLSTLRDILLPKLMSGEIKVNEITL